MSKELKITKEKVLAMAEECPEAKAVLEKGFPEAFEDESKVSASVKEEIDVHLKEIELICFKVVSDKKTNARARYAVAQLLYCHLPCVVHDEVEKGNFVANYNREKK